MLKDAIEKRLGRLFRKIGVDRTYQIGSIPLVLPADHTLPRFRRRYKAYDQPLIAITQALAALRPDAIAVDIGANAGDTAAFIRMASPTMPVVCIEGSPRYVKYLKKNAKVIGNITVFEGFVGDEGQDAYGIEYYHGGSAKLVKNQNTNSASALTVSLQTILKILETDPAKIALIKSDTDGFDFRILNASADLIERHRPVLYFEYDLFFQENATEDAIKLMEFLNKTAYSFVVFDNYGNLMRPLSGGDSLRRDLFFLNHYIKSCRTQGGALQYVDVLAVQTKELEHYLSYLVPGNQPD